MSKKINVNGKIVDADGYVEGLKTSIKIMKELRNLNTHQSDLANYLISIEQGIIIDVMEKINDDN